MYEKDLALNNLKWLICHKTKSNKHICLKTNGIQADRVNTPPLKKNISETIHKERMNVQWTRFANFLVWKNS